MAASTGPILIAGAITFGNEALLDSQKRINWRVVPATFGLALALAGLEKLSPKFAVGLAYFALAGSLLFKSGGGSPIDNANRILGFGK